FVGQADDLVALVWLAVIHARRAGRHARHGDAGEVVTLSQRMDRRDRHVPLDEFAVDHAFVTGAQARGHAQALLAPRHVGLDMIADLEAIRGVGCMKFLHWNIVEFAFAAGPRMNNQSMEILRSRKALNTTERSAEHTSELQSRENLVCRLLLEKKKEHKTTA